MTPIAGAHGIRAALPPPSLLVFLGKFIDFYQLLKVKKLTTDIEVIKEALHSSTEVQIDSTGSKVRPVIKRCTLILRDISQHRWGVERSRPFDQRCSMSPTLTTNVPGMRGASIQTPDGVCT